MARQFMGGDFRAIRRAPAPVEEHSDPRLALVDLFKGTQVAQTSDVIDLAAPLPEGTIDLSGDSPDYSALFVEDSQEPAEEPQEDGTQDSPAEPGEAAEPEPTTADEDAEPEPAPKVKADDADYDPIAAVLG